jgi:excinuclease ABC subunit C
MTTSVSAFDYQSFLSQLPHRPGVYCMLDHTNTILYVGKAKDLKKRLASYFRLSLSAIKTQALVAQIAQIEITVTPTEKEALILEHTLIKTHQPHYNILLRDDKSYPYIYLSEHQFPRLSWHRGTTQRAKGHYFGPYPHSQAVHETLNLLQKLFLLRSCRDNYYQNRSRPCLQYQIKRCSAPCVGLIDSITYGEEVQNVIYFLQGKSQTIVTNLVTKMELAAQALKFEQAAQYRDQIQQLRQIQQQQCIITNEGQVDIVAGVSENNLACIQILRIRHGQAVGNQAFFPHIPSGNLESTSVAQILTAFLPQYYLLTQEIPDEIILNTPITNMDLLAQVISEHCGKPVDIHSQAQGTRARWLAMAVENARTYWRQQQPQQYRERLAALSNILQWEILPQRLECFDVSHSQGEATVAACVVFDAHGPCYKAYRRFNIDNITPGDDYAAMQQVLQRRYQSLLTQSAPLPDIIFIDGGIGQVKVAQQVLAKLQLNNILIIGIAKGPQRTPGLESLIFLGEKSPLTLPKDSLALHLIQFIRDEAHRFAITAHRQRRAKVRRTSVLETIAGIGPKRRQRLLNYFGGLTGISQANVEDLAAVPGINQSLAQKIYHLFKST